MTDEKANPRWDSLWRAGLKIGDHFDRGETSPVLKKLIQEGQITNGRALVPGCGRGYDVLDLASESRYTVGADLSQVAVDSAYEFYRSLPVDQRPSESWLSFKACNFFEISSDESEKFDFIYDYTFLCALDPSIRHEWASKMADLVRPGGELLTLIFPIHDVEGGPPFKVSLDIVRDLLLPVGFEQLQLEMLPDELCHPDRINRSGIGRWSRT
eukprot:gene46236-61830_t